MLCPFKKLFFTLFLMSAFCLSASEDTFQSFTGKVTNNRVRLRTEPHTESAVVKEINRGDLFIVLGETDDFYAITPPKETKAYIYRTFVIDNTIEGNRVNVRLAPSLESPVVAQLNTGDRIEGNLSADNNRWFEISPPETTRFYIAKEYIENIGGPDHLASLERKKQEIDFLLAESLKMSQEELGKPYENMQLDETFGYLDRIINQYPEFPSHVAEAKKAQAELNQEYLQKKIHYLENKSNQVRSTVRNEIVDEIKVHQEKLVEVEKELEQHHNATRRVSDNKEENTSPQMATWLPIEEEIFLTWLEENSASEYSKEDFYNEQKKGAVRIRGVVQPYRRAVKNKPGDYILVNHTNNMPLAYLYSTKHNLINYVGRNVSILVIPRPNNNFAFPAYYVLEIE